MVRRAILTATLCFWPMVGRAASVMPIWQNDTTTNIVSFNDSFGHQIAIGSYNQGTGAWAPGAISIGESFTGGLIVVTGSPVMGVGAFALTVAGTPGGVVYFPTASTWASSAPLANGSLVQGGGNSGPSTFSAGGDLSFSSPNFTVTKTAGVPFGSLATLNAAPDGTLTGATLASNVLASSLTSLGTLSSLAVTGSGNQSTVNAMGSGTAVSYATPEFLFATNESYGSFGSGNTHFGFVLQSAKQVLGSTTTGSRQASTMQQLGAGGTSADYFTAGFELTRPCSVPYTCNSFNLSGNFTANNPYVYIPSGMTPTSAVGQEIDVTTLSNVTNIREGLRITDIGSTGLTGAGIDAAIGISATGIGFANGINFGDAGGAGFPLPPGATILNTSPSTNALAAGISLVGLTGAYTYAPILLAANNKGIWWGLTKNGGSVVSETAAGGGDIVLGNAVMAFRFGGVISVEIMPNSIELTPLTIAAVLAMTCNAGAEGTKVFIKDTVGNAVAAFHGTVTGGGAATINSGASCNGTNWQYE